MQLTSFLSSVPVAHLANHFGHRLGLGSRRYMLAVAQHSVIVATIRQHSAHHHSQES